MNGADSRHLSVRGADRPTLQIGIVNLVTWVRCIVILSTPIDPENPKVPPEGSVGRQRHLSNWGTTLNVESSDPKTHLLRSCL